VNRQEAAQIRAQLLERFPNADVTVERVPGGAAVSIQQPGDSLHLLVGDGSAVLMFLCGWEHSRA